MNNKRLTISLLAAVIAFAVNMGIGFFLTPYVVAKLGSEAYGFVSLANNFTSYAQILTVALNSMAGRFITVAFHRGDIEDAKTYLSSTFFANLIVCGILFIPSILCVLDLENLVVIKADLIDDVKILFAFIFVSFFITLLNSAFSSSTFVANRKDLDSKRSIESYLIKAVLLVGLFSLFDAKVFYIGVATLMSSLFILAANIQYTMKLTPELCVSKQYFSVSKVGVLIKSGIWNSIGNLGTVLADGLDLLITNMFISPAAMGVLAVAKQMPNVISTLVGVVGSVFGPNYAIAYAKNDKEDLMQKIRQSMIILGATTNVCLSVLIVIGKDFFSLWVPNQDAGVLQLLSIITISGLVFNGCLQCIFNIFTVTNKIRANALVMLGSNFLSILIVFILLKNTELGIYAVAGVSAVIGILRNLVFSIPYAAKCIDIKKKEFYRPMIINLIALIVSLVVGNIFAGFIKLNNWLYLLSFAVIYAALTLLINIVIITTKHEKRVLVEFINTKLKHNL